MKNDAWRLFYSPSLQPTPFHEWLVNTVWKSAWIQPRRTRTLTFEARPGHYSFYGLSVHAMAMLKTAPGAPSEHTFEMLDGQMIPEQHEIAIGTNRIKVKNGTGVQSLVNVMFLGDDNDTHPAPQLVMSPFLSGKQLLASQTFRELFRTEMVDREGLALKSLSILFTDLQASTALYERVGDLDALRLVRAHFDVLNDVVAKERGAVVKTIGDAVMAVFAEPDRAVKAALRMNESVKGVSTTSEDLVLKIGLHTGPCVAIQSNNQIDYFGRTVNIASRVQNVADGGEVVVTQAVWEHPRVPTIVERAGIRISEDRVRLKGINEDVSVRRLNPR